MAFHVFAYQGDDGKAGLDDDVVDELYVGYEAGIGCHHPGNIGPYFENFGVDGCGKNCGGIIRTPSAQGSGDTLAISGNKTGKNEEPGSYGALDIIEDLLIGLCKVYGRMTETGIGEDELARVLPLVRDIHRCKAGGNNSGGKQLPVA